MHLQQKTEGVAANISVAARTAKIWNWDSGAMFTVGLLENLGSVKPKPNKKPVHSIMPSGLHN
jgi:hypothetical protein